MTVLRAPSCGADSPASTQAEALLEFEQAFLEEHAAQLQLISTGES